MFSGEPPRFPFWPRNGIRQTAETVEQLQQQNAQLKTELAAERAQRVFGMEQRGGALDRASRELLQARLEIAVVKRDAALAAGPSPSAAVH
jgi:ribosomal protein L29